jgi:hypothetical protein
MRAAPELDSGAPGAFVEAKADAERELEALLPRLPQVTVTLSGKEAPQDVVVLVDGEALPAAFVGVKRPANPGKHTYSADSATLEASEVTIAVNEGGEALVELVLREKAATAPQAAKPVQAPEPEQPVDTRDSGSGLNIPAYAALGVGAIGLGVGTYFVLKRTSASKDADALDEECRTARPCDGTDVERLDELDTDAASFGTYSIIGYSVGAVGVGAGLYFLFSGGSDSASHSRDRISVWASNDQIGLAGRF